MKWETEGMWAELDEKTHTRLCECRSLAKDIPVLARSIYHYAKKQNPNFTPEDALDYVANHVSCNNQFYLTDVDEDLWNEWLDMIY